eukprot:scaffold426_cov219-Amphora_coffeaeformis.AAC.29
MTTSSLLTRPLIKDHHFGFFAGQPHHSPFPSSANTTDSSYSHQSNSSSSSIDNEFAPPISKPATSNRRVSFSEHGSLRLPSHNMSHGEARTHSPDGSTTSGGGNSSGGHTTKTGRKGDPRMHRAVSARLNDPNMTLFEALKAGGFDYPDDNNPNHLDGEKITLAQRKNQLSRRLRIARRSDNHTRFPVPSATDNQNKFESLVEKQKESFQIMQQNMELQRQNSGQQYPVAASLKRARSAQGPGTTDSQQQSPDTAARRSLLDDDEDTSVQQKQPPQMMAKFHPNFQPLLVQPTGLHYAQPAPFPNANQQQNGFNMNQGGGMFFPNAGFQIPNMTSAGAATGDINAVMGQQQASAVGAQPTPSNANISGVAMRSLTNTAQSVGLSLEQLALALSSTRNLAQVVLGNDEDGSPSEQKKKKQELALQLYQHEVRPVYSRCMMLAGFNSEMTSETSKEYLKFAWKAWQKEGRRLRDLLEENDMLVDEAPDFTATDSSQKERPTKKAKVNPPQEEQVANKHESVAHSQAHPRSHEHECHTEDGRHIHRIEKCGHKAILHQPKDGEAHIDFVVGDKVECYEGVSTQGGNSKWPSQYPCFKCEPESFGELSDADPHQQQQTSPKQNAPKVLDLSAIDLDTSEWNVDFVDGTLQGLVRLGEGSRSAESSQPGNSFPMDGDMGSANG